MPARPLIAVLFVLAAALAFAPAAQADRTFTQRFSYGGTGDVVQVGNTLMSCATGATDCDAARAGTASTAAANNNNNFTMAYVDADSGISPDPTFNSSSATLSIPAGAKVRFAGLYFGGRSNTSAANRAAVSFRVPRAAGYASLTASQVDTSTPTSGDTASPFYQGFVDVTNQVEAAGSGTYWVGNVESDLTTDRSAGWSLVVAYSLPTETRRQLYVYDGLTQVNRTVGSVDILLDDLATPPSGIVDGRIGIVANEGDLGITGDRLSVGGVAMSDGLNPADNVFNSTIGNSGTRSSAKTPDYVNQLGWDVDTLALPSSAIPAGATSTRLSLSSTQDAYLPGVVTLVSKAETDPPTTTLDPVPATTNNPTPRFTFQSSEDRSTFECRLDGGAFTTCASGYTAPRLPDGSHTFEVRAIDRVGNVDPAPAAATFTVDTVAPDTTIDAGPANGATIANATPTLRFSSDDPTATFRCSIDGATPTPCSSPLTTGRLADGPHTFVVYAVDAAGNDDSAAPARRVFTVDTTPPDTTITRPADGSTVTTTTPDLVLASNESGVRYECSIDGAAYGACSSPLTLGPLAQGRHTVAARAIDAAGLVDATPARTTFTVDTIAPDTTITAPADGSAVNTARPRIAFTATEAGATFECSLDGAEFSPCTSPLTAGPLADGTHSVAVRAIDAAGNRDASPAATTFTVDTVKPTVTIQDGPAPTTTDRRPTLRSTANETGAALRCSIDSTALRACPASFTPDADLADGPHTFRVQAVDRAGNASDIATRTFTVDGTPPETTIDSGPADGSSTTDAAPSFGFSSEPGARFECSLDGAAFAACTSPTAFTGLADGSHSFRVRAIDTAGNVDPTPAARTFRVDTTAPETTIELGPANGTTVTTARPVLRFSSNEAGATFRCSVDGAAAVPCSSPRTLGPLADGPHSVVVYAVDAAGNVDATPSRRDFKVDATAPSLSIDAGPADGATITDPTPTLQFSTDDPSATLRCTVDGKAVTPCTSPLTLDKLADGRHTVVVTTTDPAGNATSATRRFTVDTTPPDTTISRPADGSTVRTTTPDLVLTSTERGVTFECSIDGAPYTACTSPQRLGPLAQGPHTVAARATDAAGLVDATPARTTFTVDTVAPKVTIDAGPAEGSTVTDPTPTLEFSTDDRSATLRCTVDGKAVTPCRSPLTLDELADGPHTVVITATDPAGNASTTTRRFTVDATAPTVTIDAGPAEGATISDPAPTLEFSTKDRTATLTCTLDGTTVSPCRSPLGTGPLADGPHTFTVTASDPAGNATSATRRFTVDTTPPDTTISRPADGSTVRTATPDLVLTSTERGVTFECSVDGGAYAACTSPQRLGPLAQGPHTVAARATDAAGNQDATPAVTRFTVDSASTTVDGPTGTIATPTATFTLGPDQPGVTFECSLDGGEYQPCASPWTTPALGDGEHRLDVRSVDAQGGRDQTPATIQWTVAVPQAGGSAGTPAATSPGTATTPAAPTPTPTAPATPAPAEAEDLGAVLSSAVRADRCQLLAGPGFVKRRTPRGVGRVRLQMRSNATSPPGTPLRLTIARVAPRLRTVAYRLDGRPVRAGRRFPYALRLTPRRLATRSRHTLRVTFTARDGRRTSYRLRFRTLRCSAMLSLSQTRLTRGTRLRLRVDSVRALSRVSVRLPRATLRRLGGRRVLLLRVRSAASRRTLAYRYRLRRGVPVGPRRAPSVRLTRAGVTIAGLPARTGIVRLDTTTLATPLGGLRGALVRGTARTSETTVRLATRTRAPARR